MKIHNKKISKFYKLNIDINNKSININHLSKLIDINKLQKEIYNISSIHDARKLALSNFKVDIMKDFDGHWKIDSETHIIITWEEPI